MFSSKLQLRHQHCILTFQFRQPKVSHSKNPEIYRLEEPIFEKNCSASNEMRTRAASPSLRASPQDNPPKNHQNSFSPSNPPISPMRVAASSEKKSFLCVLPVPLFKKKPSCWKGKSYFLFSFLSFLSFLSFFLFFPSCSRSPHGRSICAVPLKIKSPPFKILLIFLPNKWGSVSSCPKNK